MFCGNDVPLGGFVVVVPELPPEGLEDGFGVPVPGVPVGVADAVGVFEGFGVGVDFPSSGASVSFPGSSDLTGAVVDGVPGFSALPLAV